MNIFVTDPCPRKSAQVLPDKHVVKMPLETCQMLSIVFSHWYYDWGDDLLKKKDALLTKQVRVLSAIIHVHNVPFQKFIQYCMVDSTWCVLSTEYTHRYGKEHGCRDTLCCTKKAFHRFSEKSNYMLQLC